jgi:starch synthase
VGIVTPLYQGILERFPTIQKHGFPLDLPLGLRSVQGEVWSLEPKPNLTIYFVAQPEFFQRKTMYQKEGVDYPDNPERFLFFAKVVAQLALHLPWRPEVVHLHDWHTGFAALLLAHHRQGAAGKKAPPVCMTIHNLAYQGIFPASKYELANLPWDYFNIDGVEFYGQVSCLKAGIVYADRITTVSPRYAREITTEEFGCGLGGLLRHRQSALVGILSGIDYEEWNTTHNAFLAHSYSATDLGGKNSNKLELQKELGLPPKPDVPLFGSVGRMAEQKGSDIMLGALEQTLSANIQFALLGRGAPVFEKAYQELMRRFPTRVAVKLDFDEGLSHRIEAGSDFFLMPSRFEPCGLNQMYSMRYGTIPIVRATGGLDDTVIDLMEEPQNANGIKFSEYSSRALAKSIRKAVVLYQDRDMLQQFRRNAMAADFSWTRAAQEYVRCFESIC